MSTARTLSSLPQIPHPRVAGHRTIALWTPPHRRLAAAVAALLHSVSRSWAAAAQRRAQTRAARLEHAALAQLDSRTLRDIGLGDWAASARDSDAAQLHREVTLRGL
jgi:uncharacterized protein YjiS (DUF1127 family)